MQKRFLCLMLCLAIVLPVGSFALAAEGIQAEEEAAPYFLVDGIAYEDPGLTVYNNITYVSVSYTHLDVYKRQDIGRSPRPAEEFH